MQNRSNLFAACLAVLSSTAIAQSDEDKATYAVFADRMDLWQYGWEPFKVQTEDGFILTTFRITENLNNPDRVANPDYKPIIMANGYECDGTSWIPTELGDTVPTALHLFDDGFDVYLMSNRGTKYCQEHTTYDILSEEYWYFSFAEMGIYDDFSNIKAVKERTGSDKVSFLGYSQSSQHGLYMLAEREDELVDDLFTLMLFAPCTVSNDYTEHSVYTEGVFKFQDDGIYNLGGPPNWWDTLDHICDTYPQNVCDYASGYGYAEPVPVQGEVYGGQQHMTKRFQDYSPDFYENPIMPLIPIDMISRVPITMWTSGNDQTCGHPQAVDARDTIGDDVVKFTTVPGGSHQLWGRPLKFPIYNMVKNALINPEGKTFDLSEQLFNQL